MRFILLTLCLFFIRIELSAQNGLNFQGVARNPSGVILASQKIALKFSILSDHNNTIEFSETRIVNTNAQGIFSVIIGDTGAANTIGGFNNITWKLGSKFLKVEMDPNGGNTFVDMGTTQLQNVPYAYYAKGVNASNIDGILPVSAGGSGVTNLSQFKAAINLDLVNNTSDINKPISNAMQFALDTKVASATFSTSLSLKEDNTNKSTNTSLGGILSSDLLYPSQKAVKAYVDAQISTGGVSDNGITSVKIADGTIVNADISNIAAIPFSKLNITKSDINNLGIPSNTDLVFYDAGNGLTLNGSTFNVSSNVLTSTYTGPVSLNGSSFSVDNNTFFVDGTNHKIGIGTNTPISKFEVNGAATNSTAYDANNGTTIDFALSNLAYTSASAGAFVLNNIKDGGTYTLAVQGNTSGTASFTSNGFTFYSSNNDLTASNKQTLYTFIVMGAKVYYFMSTGF